MYTISAGSPIVRMSKGNAIEHVFSKKEVCYTKQELVKRLMSPLGFPSKYRFRLPESAHPWREIEVDAVYVK